MGVILLLISVPLSGCQLFPFTHGQNNTSSAGINQLLIDKDEFKPGEEVYVSYNTAEPLPENAWIGIIPAFTPHGNEAENDKHDVSYRYLSGSTAGKMTFKAPTQPGIYDFRLNSSDNNGKELAASKPFKVKRPPATETMENVEVWLRLDKTTPFRPGEEIVVRFQANPNYNDNAWVGIIPSSVAHGDEALNDQYDMTYQYLSKRSAGELRFTAPTEPGYYDLRMHDTDNSGREVASVSFSVE